MQYLKLWTVRPETDYFILEKQGAYSTDEHLVFQHRLIPYRWIAQKLAEKVPAPMGITLPIWAWYRAHGLQRIKPDLRKKGHLSQGERGVRIEFEVPENQVLLSSFDGWHAVLNNHCFTLTDEEYEFYENLEMNMSAKEFQKVKQATWDKIFDLSLLPDPNIYEVQAVLWQIKLEWVKKVDFFIAK